MHNVCITSKPESIHTNMHTILDHVPTKLRWQARTNGGEYAGPCPWCGGNDRFRVWPRSGAHGRYWCRQCGRSGDAIRLVRELRHMSFAEACRYLDIARPQPVPRPAARPASLTAPPKVWQDRAWQYAEAAIARLWSDQGIRARRWLRGRGLSEETMQLSMLGYHPRDVREPAAAWGLDREGDIFIPRGITIPWVIDSELWRFNVRRPAGTPRYMGPAGSSNGLYNVADINAGHPVVLVEGEIDALSVMQATGIPAVATGSASGSRRRRWVLELMKASIVLIAFDSDEAGETASAFWYEALPDSRRLRPYRDDVNQMLQDGIDLKRWVNDALAA